MSAPRDSYTRYPRAILWLLPGGRVTVGGNDPDNRPAQSVSIEPFYASKLPISNLQFEAYRSDYRRCDSSPGDADPAVGLCFGDAVGYCRWYASVSRKAIRLLSELEWEYAARADGKPGRPCCGEGVEQVPDLGRSKPNGLGLQAMLGGVWEWTSSLYLPPPVAPGDNRDDLRLDGERVLRGGSFRMSADRATPELRRGADPQLVRDDVGFRIARSF